MARHDIEFSVWIEGRSKKWEPINMIPMGVSKQHIAMLQISFNHLLTKIANTGATIEQKGLTANLNFKTGRIATIFQVGRCRTRDTTATSPNFYSN
jgi:hypothetical protein